MKLAALDLFPFRPAVFPSLPSGPEATTERGRGEGFALQLSILELSDSPCVCIQEGSESGRSRREDREEEVQEEDREEV